jgi:hypothetical protein
VRIVTGNDALRKASSAGWCNAMRAGVHGCVVLGPYSLRRSRERPPVCRSITPFGYAHADARHSACRPQPEQKPFYENMRAGIVQNFKGFTAIGDDGALLGPFNPWVHEPKFGKPIWELVKAISTSPWYRSRSARSPFW